MKKAYVVVDMSNDFVHDEGGLTAGAPAQAIEGNILKRVEEFDNEGCVIVFAMDAHQPDDDHFRLWAPHNVVGTWGAELYGKLGQWYEQNKDKSNVYYLPKGEYDAFYQTDLADILHENEVDVVYISGVCTDICVFNTVYGAYKAGFPTIVAKDEVATFTANGEIFLNQMNAIYKTEII